LKEPTQRKKMEKEKGGGFPTKEAGKKEKCVCSGSEVRTSHRLSLRKNEISSPGESRREKEYQLINISHRVKAKRPFSILKNLGSRASVERKGGEKKEGVEDLET